MDGKTVRFLSASAVFLAVALYGCAGPELPSNWLDREITIDGKNPEWAGAEAYYSEEQGIKIGFFNDERYLYVYLASWHRQDEMQILRNGLTVWFDPAGGKKQAFGIRYPLQRKMAPSDLAARGGAFRERIPGMRGERPDSFPSAAETSREQRIPADVLIGARSVLEVIRPGEGEHESLAMPDSSGIGVDAMIDVVNRTLIYELRVPLQRIEESPYAIGAKPGQKIGVGLLVGKRERSSLERPEGAPEREMGEEPGGMGRPAGEGMGGFPGGRRGDFGGMRGGMTAEPLELWVTVKLAVKAAGAHTE
jgi:hypothetical protein